ncbi:MULTISPECIES: hypothetical protein [unclassified Pseudoalteromonas]|uniref:hypothetical protein n=1 Tax=unclassified Pseudoalteromonas TaxID=194690 RepID=UPI00110C1E2E|nr:MULTISPECIES: hypothetical protein [unclassified Pseudoalteromonas]TMP43303.1 hypothetical protein CWB80_16465 [Pseudoalteromonas sp. S1650]TMP68999.1 hypothetical protein CWB79_03630 [Pseudoalteromonas sp. S1649]
MLPSRPTKYPTFVTSNNAAGDVIIVEAKGGKSPLGKKQIGDKDYQQGTREYAETITENMDKKGTATDIKATKAINKATSRKKNEIKYLHIETPIYKTEQGSIVKEVKISEFDIGN